MRSKHDVADRPHRVATGGQWSDIESRAGVRPFVVAQLAMGAAILAIFPAVFASANVGPVYWTLTVITAASLPSVATLDGTFMHAGSPDPSSPV